MKFEVIIRKSNRKSISIAVTDKLEVLVKAPVWLSDEQILEFIREKKSWIETNLEKRRLELENTQTLPPITMEDVRKLADKALNDIPPRVKRYAALIDVTYGKITIRNQVSRWGSCSSNGNLNFNCLLMLAPEEVIDYVVVHELCHRKHMNHSPLFWDEIRKIMPDYEKSVRWLKENGGSLIARMRG